MFIWGLVMVKAKTGFNAANSKDQSTIKSLWKHSLYILVLIIVATIIQLKTTLIASTTNNISRNILVPTSKNLNQTYEDTR